MSSDQSAGSIRYGGEYPSVVDLQEKELVRLVMEDWRTRRHVLSVDGFPKDPTWRLEVPMTGLPGRSGDVDILAWNVKEPQHTVAMEAKRFKADVSGSEKDRINKLHEYEKGVRRANLLADIGFSLVYLLVFVLVDSRRQNAEAIAAGKIVYDGMTPELDRVVRSTVNTAGLHPRVGLMLVEYVQSMDETPVFGIGTSGGRIVRKGTAIVQARDVTQWVSERA